MSEGAFFVALRVWIILGCIVFVALLFVVAPYGRYAQQRGASLNNRLGWILMEAPSPLLFATLFFVGSYNTTFTAWVFLILWQLHYLHRSFIYPLGIRGNKTQMPVAIFASSVVFNLINAYFNGRYLFGLSGGYANAWLSDPRFIIGVLIFLIGFVINRWADRVLRELRKPGESVYRLPTGGLYRWISCPNYLGEMLVWIGWAIATWSLSGFAFALWTVANLAPRARAHHLWYKTQFAQYPSERRALLPGIW